MPAELVQKANETILALDASESLTKGSTNRRGAASDSEGSDTDTNRHGAGLHEPTLSRRKTDPGDGAVSRAKTSNTKVMDKFVQQGKKNLTENANNALTLFLVCNGVPPVVVDSGEFKDFVSILNNSYLAASSSTVRDRLVPSSSTIAHANLIAHLRATRNLTIGFDGGKTRKPSGVYTITVTTPDREAFLLELNDASRVSHTAEYICEILMKVREHCFITSSSVYSQCKCMPLK